MPPWRPKEIYGDPWRCLESLWSSMEIDGDFGVSMEIHGDLWRRSMEMFGVLMEIHGETSRSLRGLSTESPRVYKIFMKIECCAYHAILSATALWHCKNNSKGDGYNRNMKKTFWNTDANNITFGIEQSFRCYPAEVLHARHATLLQQQSSTV